MDSFSNFMRQTQECVTGKMLIPGFLNQNSVPTPYKASRQLSISMCWILIILKKLHSKDQPSFPNEASGLFGWLFFFSLTGKKTTFKGFFLTSSLFYSKTI